MTAKAAPTEIAIIMMKPMNLFMVPAFIIIITLVKVFVDFSWLAYNGSMSQLVKRGFGAYKIFLKNKMVSSIMMLFSGFMMFIAALNGKGNDTKSLPILITVLGALLSFWTSFCFWRLKKRYDQIDETRVVELKEQRKALFFQGCEAVLSFVVLGLGIFLLCNENVMNKVLNLMAGGFTTLNGVLGAINAVKHRKNKDFQWKFMLVLTVFELILGPYFIFGSDTIGIVGFTIMGALTTIAGICEVINVMSHDNLKSTIDDGKKIVQVLKDGEATAELKNLDEEDEEE